MRPIQIQLLSGPGSGRQATFTQSPITFGRDSTNLLILSDAQVSRQHGEIRLENNQWVLINLSPRGTRVGWRTITKKPYILREKDVLTVGNQPAFKITFGQDDQPQAQSNTSDTLSKPSSISSLSKRSKLWIAIGFLWILAIVAAAVFQMGLIGTDRTLPTNLSANPTAPELTADQIRAEINRPLPPLPQPDERAARESLKRAIDLANSLQVSSANLYRSYRAYQEHLAAQGKDNPSFADPMDRLRFEELKKQLADKVIVQYRRAYDRLKSQNFGPAAEEFYKLTRLYDDPDSLIYRNAIQHQKWARDQVRKR